MEPAPWQPPAPISGRCASIAERLMIGGVVVAHGLLAEEMINTAEMIVGKIPNVAAVSIDMTSDVESSRDHIRRAIHEMDTGSGVVVFTDMFGGTPSNISLSFLDDGHIEVITGVNLAMLVQFSMAREKDAFADLVTALKQRGQENIHIASEFLQRRGKK